MVGAQGRKESLPAADYRARKDSRRFARQGLFRRDAFQSVEGGGEPVLGGGGATPATRKASGAAGCPGGDREVGIESCAAIRGGGSGRRFSGHPECERRNSDAGRLRQV